MRERVRFALASAFVSLASSFQGADARRLAVVLPLLFVLSAYYLFQSTAGTFRTLSWQTNRYDLLSEGFRHGHLYLPLAPSPELLAKTNPFAFANKPLWFWDASLFNGRYYIYWGPVPALCLLAYKWITGLRTEIADQWLVLFFFVGRLYGGAALVLGFASHVRTRQSAWITALVILVFGLASPTPLLLARPLIYEASVAAGQCFLFWGLAAAFQGLVRKSQRTVLFVLAGVLWGLALGSRVSLIISAPFFVLVTVGVLWLRPEQEFPRVRHLFALAVPVALSFAAYGAYNYARFGSVFEFGVTNQVTTQRFTSNRIYLVANLFSYAFANLDWSCSFPFVIAPNNRPAPHVISWPASYVTYEKVAGMFTASPFCWLLTVWIVRPARGCLALATRRPSSAAPRASAAEIWLVLCSIAAIFSFALVLPLFEAHMRYLEDAIGGAVMASAAGGFWLLRLANSSPNKHLRRMVRAALAALAVYTIFVGVFSGFATFEDNFEHSNPFLYRSLKRTLSVCAAKRL